MAEKVFLHIGLPKTGTTYLQQVLWDNRDLLRKQGVLLPGRNHREHLWAALSAQGRTGLEKRHRRAPGTWGRFAAELAAWPGTGLVSHEFFCGAGVAAIKDVVASLEPAEVHVVVTARDALGMLTAGWQERVKNGDTLRPEAVAGAKQQDSEFSWRTWDLGGVLERWSEVIAPERLHVLVLPGRDAAPGQHWHNFAETIGLQGDFPLPEQVANPSIGVVQVELLRRINAELGDFRRPSDRGTWIRGHLAEKWLALQEGDRLVMTPELVADCRRRSTRAVELIGERGLHVVGDVESLLVPVEPARGRPIDTVTDAELVEASAQLVAVMLADVRDLTRELDQARAPREPRFRWPGRPV